MKVAIIHHWFVTRGGGERVAECMAALFPEAELFTLIANEVGLPGTLAARRLHTSLLDRLPWAHNHHRHFLPLFPAATERLNLEGFDLVLSSDSGPVKGVLVDRGATHICYCHSPMRYLWDGYESYRETMGPLTRAAFTLTAGRLRRWDAQAAKRVSHFLANSINVADRIERCYGRHATVVHPPIDLERAAAVGHAAPSVSYLCAGRLVAYKRTELLVEACIQLGRPLRIAGIGPELSHLKRVAAGHPNIAFLGALTDEELWSEYACCRALLFAADEDFGMVPLEAQACGRPVIAYGHGGSLETVRGADAAHPTGIFFKQQTVEAVREAIVHWEQHQESRFEPEDARGWASEFSTPRFLQEYRAFVLRHVPQAASAMITVDQAMEIVSPKARSCSTTSEQNAPPCGSTQSHDQQGQCDDVVVKALR